MNQRGQKTIGKLNNKAQVTIFIILALILIVGIVFIFLLRRGPEVSVVSEENPQAYIEGCTRDALEEALDLIMINAGDIEPKSTVLYQGQNISYLCYQENYYYSCINQKPLLLEHIQDQIDLYIKPMISNCFQVLETTLEPRYEVEMEEYWDLNAKLTSKSVEVYIDREFKMQRGSNVRNFNLFKTSIVHPIYHLAETAMEIVNQEAEFCNFDVLGFMIIYPQYDIKKFRTGDSNIIYTLREFAGNKEFKFAIRGCVIPPGY